MSDDENTHKKHSKILFDVIWTFRRKIYGSKKIFSRAVKKHQIKITGKDSWQADEIVIEKPQIKVILERDWEYPPDDRIEFALESEDRKNFTALDLMFQLNNFLAGYDLGDKCFFEGLKFDAENKKYFLNLGS